MKRTGFIWILLYMVGIKVCLAQPPHTFTYYTSENGLSQKTVQSILQDHKGLMWFATWDGLYKFDGYTFKNYKAYPGDNTALSNNRFDSLKEDCYGYLWMQSYDHQIFRFDPNSEKFESIPYDNYIAQDFYVLPTGDIWITTQQKECIHVTIDSKTREMKAEDFFQVHPNYHPEKVNKIFLDKQQTQWILTNNGLYQIAKEKNEQTSNSFFVVPTGKDNTPFYDALQHDNTLYFTSDSGCVWQHKNGSFQLKRFPTQSSIKFIRPLKGSELFVGTASNGFFIYNTETNHTEHFCKKTLPTLPEDLIREVYIDTHHEIWLRHRIPGATHFNPQNKHLDYFILQDKYGKDIVDSRPEMYIYEDINGSLWLHPSGGGLAWYDRAHNQIHPFYNPALQTGWSTDNRVTGLFTDKQGNLWICSYENGLEKVTFNTNHFHLLTARANDSGFPGNNTRAIFQDKDGNIWTGNRDKIIRIYNENFQYIGNLNAQGQIIPNSKDQIGIAYSFTQDHTGTIWIGTKGNGLIAATPEKKPLHFRLRQYTTNENDNNSLSGNDIYSLHEDRHHRLWIATFEGGINYLDLKADSKSPRFINHRNLLKNYPIKECYRTRFVTSAPNGNIWIGSTTGLLMCEGDFDKPEDIRFQRFQRIPSDVHSLGNDDIHNIFFTSQNEMYIATFGGGLNKLNRLQDGSIQFQAYTPKDGLASDIILSIEEDKEGSLWLATEEALCKFIPATGKMENYTSKTFPIHINFGEGKSVKTRRGELMFNTTKGVLYFRPDSIKINRYAPAIIFTDFQQTDNAGLHENNILSANIDETRFIELPHDRNNFSIQFAALDLRYPNSISYAYRLKGFENEWNYVGNQRTANYTNLPKGNYTLEVKSTNSDGVWVDNVRTMQLTVLPSFWETPWAYGLYTLIILLIIISSSYILFVIYRLKHKVAIERQIADIKLHFFTDISHELRTPLTLIIGPIEHILRNGRLQPEEKESLTLVENNANRMLHLVNQILDFHKIQHQKMKMQVRQVEVASFVRHIMDHFSVLAEERQMDFALDAPQEPLVLWADADKLEKIVFNLLSNAFKYTPQGKQIKVTIADAGADILIAVQDQGIGIAENKQQNLFVRFENLLDRSLFHQPSTGIGLSLVKELIEMHHGSITLQSRQGEGSKFTVRLPKGKEHFDEQTEFILADQPMITDVKQVYQDASLTFLIENDKDEVDKEKDTLLIAEDNNELRSFLRTIFTPYFNVIEAENGQVGLKKCKEFLPDIIISDIMMPQMDGRALVHALREEMTTSHIPIVLLTAKTTLDDKIEGMQLGADDYITKPFSTSYLKARIFNLLEQRKRLQAMYCANLMPDPDRKQEPSEELVQQLSPNDRRFMDKVMEFIEQNLDNGNLSVEDIATEVHMSRSVYFKKIKTLTGLSPVEFLREFRMKRAAQLILTKEYSMAQIAYMVGVNDSHYFSKLFKQQFGMTPTEYKEKQKTNG